MLPYVCMRVCVCACICECVNARVCVCLFLFAQPAHGRVTTVPVRPKRCYYVAKASGAAVLITQCWVESRLSSAYQETGARVLGPRLMEEE